MENNDNSWKIAKTYKNTINKQTSLSTFHLEFKYKIFQTKNCL